ncbi:matrix metalloproteinase-21-like [Carcharodon carcharias]|uniref:matrix metalloproteinase-21-like n=1 Tax=Carcharodon carcharias TaxID=13397 RepID=UPI001B7F0494|nr:matrix metalloproteinase-21-like [Carcharodon carcharias]
MQLPIFLVLAAAFPALMPGGGEPVFNKRDHSDTQLNKHRAPRVLTAQTAEEYLKKFGWGDPIDWEYQVSGKDLAPPEENPAPRDVLQIMTEGISGDSVTKDHLKQPNNNTSYLQNLKEFQKANGLSPTGILDNATLSVMNLPRCGVPDKMLLENSSLINATSRNDLDSTSSDRTSSDSNTTRPATGPESIRRKRFLNRLVKHARRKRGSLDALGGAASSLAFSKRKLKWRLMDEAFTIQMSVEEQKSILRLAFRMWSEVTPLEFEEDLASLPADIDIKLGFGTGQHLGCSQDFDGTGQIFAHAWYLADIHFDDAEHFVVANNGQGISLLTVAVHEIGHALGLSHLLRTGSVMHPNYNTQSENFELGWLDRKAIQRLYGVCEGAFSTVFDWVYQRENSDGTVTYHFNTYFFRKSWYWMYENRSNRTRYGDPIPISAGWRNLPDSDIDAFVHIWTWSSNLEEKRDAQYFFKGTQYWHYDPINDMAFTQDAHGTRYPKLISDGFPGAPSPIDTAYFDRRDRNIYFFRGDEVTAFTIDLNQKVNGFPRKIVNFFPPTVAGDHPLGNLDAAFYSYTHRALFFMKDQHFWRVVSETEHQANPALPARGLHGRRRVSEQWFDICDIHPSMLSAVPS